MTICRPTAFPALRYRRRDRPGELDVIGGNVDNAVAMRHIPATIDGHLAGPDGIVLDPDHHYFVVLRVEYLR
jgi:hypothetical protein